MVYSMENKVLTKLKIVREKYKYNYLDMAKKLSISKTFYWQIENGYRRLTYKMAKKIACVLKTKPDDLFYNDF